MIAIVVSVFSKQNKDHAPLIFACNWPPFQSLKINMISIKINFYCFTPYSKSFIDQACPVKMAGYWPCAFFVFIDLDFVSVYKHAKT